MNKSLRVILGVTGSIAAYKAAELCRRLKEKDIRVSVVMTKCAEKFITPLTMAGLSGEKTYNSLFGKNQENSIMPHIDLAQETSAVVIAPATANIIGKMACGLADDLLTCIALGTKAPILIAPAMNTEMYNNKIVQENCEKLKKAGMTFITPVSGKLACGVVGQGHIAAEEDIINAVLKAIKYN